MANDFMVHTMYIESNGTYINLTQVGCLEWIQFIWISSCNLLYSISCTGHSHGIYILVRGVLLLYI